MPGIAEGADLGFVGLLQHGDDVGIIIHMLDIGHAAEPAEEPAEGQMLLRRQVLVAEEEDEVLDEGAPDLRRRRVAEWRRQIDAGNLRPQRAGDRPHGDRLIGHAVSPPGYLKPTV